MAVVIHDALRAAIEPQVALTGGNAACCSSLSTRQAI
jgi:hypothetical protein